MKGSFLIILFLFMGGCSLIPSNKQHDKQLVGMWKGLRSDATGCMPLSWNLDRKADGTFSVQFYIGNIQMSSEIGKWWTSGNTIYVISPPSKKPDGYTYDVLNESTIKFTKKISNQISDCINEPSFTDHKVDNF